MPATHLPDCIPSLVPSLPLASLSCSPPTLASLARASASTARPSASAALSHAAFSSSSCFFWYRGARLRLSRSCTWACRRAWDSASSRRASSEAATASADSCEREEGTSCPRGAGNAVGNGDVRMPHGWQCQAQAMEPAGAYKPQSPS